MTPEGKVKEKVKRLLKQFPIYYHMPVQNGMGAPSLDFIGCAWGFYFGIETKAGMAGKPTPRQRNTMDRIESSGGQTFLVDDSTESLVVLEQWLHALEMARKCDT